MSNRNEPRGYLISTSLGPWTALFTDAGLRELRLPGSVLKSGRHPGRACGGSGTAFPKLTTQEGAAGRRLCEALAARLAGEETDLPWVGFDLAGRPPFFERAWEALYEIPFGEVRTYGQIAAAAGSPDAVRAAGQACGANPIVLFIPCHRVVAANGPGGFGAGLEWKRRLLEFEGRQLA
jgi:methylated-DNA-[protein]-cysteine S-methyltransferase